MPKKAPCPSETMPADPTSNCWKNARMTLINVRLNTCTQYALGLYERQRGKKEQQDKTGERRRAHVTQPGRPGQTARTA